MSNGSSKVPLVLLAASVLLSATGHLILRDGAEGAIGLAELSQRIGIYFGLVIYGLGTVLWILCLRRLDLALAYPASAVQIALVYIGSAAWLGERIPPGRLLGVTIIITGILLLFSERGRKNA